MAGGPGWDDGEYEVFAPALVPAAEHLLALAAPRPGERAIDLGCGSGNVTLPLLEAGAVVTAVDPSLRLLGVTTERAKAAGHDLAAVNAGAESLPLPDGDADLIVSNFGVIFCPEPQAAVAELVRVLAPGGRVLLTAWLPHGTLVEVAMRMRAASPGAQHPGRPALAARIGEPGDAPAVLWHDPASFAGLLPAGTATQVQSGEVRFAGASPQAWVQQMEDHHPMWLAARAVIDDDAWVAMRADVIELVAADEQPDGSVLITSPYVVVELHPGAQG